MTAAANECRRLEVSLGRSEEPNSRVDDNRVDLSCAGRRADVEQARGALIQHSEDVLPNWRSQSIAIRSGIRATEHDVQPMYTRGAAIGAMSTSSLAIGLQIKGDRATREASFGRGCRRITDQVRYEEMKSKQAQTVHSMYEQEMTYSTVADQLRSSESHGCSRKVCDREDAETNTQTGRARPGSSSPSRNRRSSEGLLRQAAALRRKMNARAANNCSWTRCSYRRARTRTFEKSQLIDCI